MHQPRPKRGVDARLWSASTIGFPLKGDVCEKEGRKESRGYTKSQRFGGKKLGRGKKKSMNAIDQENGYEKRGSCWNRMQGTGLMDAPRGQVAQRKVCSIQDNRMVLHQASSACSQAYINVRNVAQLGGFIWPLTPTRSHSLMMVP